MNKFEDLREKYPVFIFNNYDYEYKDNFLEITYHFEIPGLTSFNPTLKISMHEEKKKDAFLDNLIFNIGMVELVSYFKCTCSKEIIIKAGYLSEEQIGFFSKLYYYGLGEFLYLNNIDIKEEDLINIKCLKDEQKIIPPAYVGCGNLIPIGGGKDSVVSLEILKEEQNNSCFIINPKPTTIECCKVGGYNLEDIITVKRVIDKNLLELNKQGFLNGHTPFSSVVAFISYLAAYLNNKKYIVLSNEDSANEATVLGTKINHQYSKTYEFENDFNEYTKKYFKIDIKYFSLLRPLSEFQIGMLFSSFKKYHPVFKSCNVGSKMENWSWCCNCPKCLFVYTILSPFLYKDDLVSIFGEDLFARDDLLNTFVELIGYSDKKPFECVGTYSEVRYAISLIIEKLKKKDLPYLLDYYYKNYPLELETDYMHMYNYKHNLDPHFEELLERELDKHV